MFVALAQTTSRQVTAPNQRQPRRNQPGASGTPKLYRVLLVDPAMAAGFRLDNVATCWIKRAVRPRW